MEEKTIGDCDLNSGWIKDCLGSTVLSKVADKRSINSAISLGTASAAIEYAHQMSHDIMSWILQTCERDGLNAGLHNFMLYSGGVKGVLRFDQLSGPMIDIQVRGCGKVPAAVEREPHNIVRYSLH